MFKETLGLCTDPFDPHLPDLPQLDLLGEALRLDKHAALRDLYCRNINGLLQGERRVMRELQADRPGYVDRQAIIVINGGIGTGKSSFAYHLKSLITLHQRQGRAWHEHELAVTTDPITQETMGGLRGGGFLDQLGAFEEEVSGSVQPGDNLFLLIDNVPPRWFPSVVTLYKKFNAQFRIIVCTTVDPELKQDDLSYYYSPNVQLIEVDNVRAEDVETYVKERVSRFWDPKRSEFFETSPLFPFAPSAIPRIVDRRLPMRMVNRRLHQELVQKHDELALNAGFNAGMASRDELLNVLIR